MTSKADTAIRQARNKAVADRARAKGKKPYLAVSDAKNMPRRGPKKTPKTHGTPIPKPKLKKAQTCGAQGGRLRDGRRCSRAAGWGTDHPGTGRCANHGGKDPTPTRSTRTRHQQKQIDRANRALPSDHNTVVVDKNAPKNLNDAKQLLGIPVEMNPMDALMWCVRLTAGEIVWYSDRMQELREDQWIEDTFVGKQLHMYARNRTVSIDRLAKYSKWAVDSGIAERAMRLAEAYGEQLYQLLHGVLLDLDLTPHQRQRAPEIITRHLMQLERKNLTNSPNELVVGRDPETIDITDPDDVKVVNP
jgi:hypothetical protein